METEPSSFETSEMLATFLASTPLLSESWKLCSHANTAAPLGFVANRAEDVAYVAFSSVQAISALDPSHQNLVRLDGAGDGVFSGLQRHLEGEEPVMVHAGLLQLFLYMYHRQDFQIQMLDIMRSSKSVVFTGHSMGGTIASLSALWLLSYLQTISSSLSVFCITFGSSLLGNQSLSRSVLQERWGGNFCHVIGKHDIVPRLLFAPLAPIAPQLHLLLHFWHRSMASPYFGPPAAQLNDEQKRELFLFVSAYGESLANAPEEALKNLFCPFGSYMFCTDEGAICLDNPMAIVKLLHFMFSTGSATSCIEDHLKYEDYVGKILLSFLKRRGLFEGDLPNSSYEAGVALALQSSEIATQESVSESAKDCLEMAKRMGGTPNLNCAKLAISLSKITPKRAQIEWYKKSCDESDDQMGYYDSFKLRGASKKDFKVNLNRLQLGEFWDEVIRMLDTNQLPLDFHKREKWVNACQFYKLLVEPLDIAEYYRSGMHLKKGHYLKHGRDRRYEVSDRWWRGRKVGKEEKNGRSKFASLTQDSCFWARVEEAKEWLYGVRSERDARKLSVSWENIEEFEKYARRMVERKEVSRDVIAPNSSYSLWVEELRVLKSQQSMQLPHQFPGYHDAKLVP